MILVVMVMFKNTFAQTGDLRIHRTNGRLTKFALSKIIRLEFPDENNLWIYHLDPNKTIPYIMALSEFDSLTFDKIEGSVTDIEGKTYRTVKIDNDWWMAENLNTTQYNTGVAITEVPLREDWKGNLTEAYCNYDNNASHVAKYGRLYNWHAVNTGNLAPDGWHVSTKAEWDHFYLGNLSVGAKLKSKETATEDNWKDGPGSNDGGGNDFYGFTALPGGYRTGSSGYFYSMGEYAKFWTLDWANPTSAYYADLYYFTPNLRINDDYKSYGMSVRCVRD